MSYWFLAFKAAKPSGVIKSASIDLSLPMTTFYAETGDVLR
jgi:hypothetical protein